MIDYAALKSAMSDAGYHVSEGTTWTAEDLRSYKSYIYFHWPNLPFKVACYGLAYPEVMPEDFPIDGDQPAPEPGPDPLPGPIPEPDPQPEQINVLPIANSLRSNGSTYMKGSNINADHAVTITDGVIELAISPLVPYRKVLAPDEDGKYHVDGEEDISALFAVSSPYALSEVLSNYAVTLTITSDSQSQVLKLQDGKWVKDDDPNYILSGTVKTATTIQNVTRGSFFLPKSENTEVYVLTATSVGTEPPVVLSATAYVERTAEIENTEDTTLSGEENDSD